MSISYINEILNNLQQLPYSQNIYVVGSVSRQESSPKDLDVVVIVDEQFDNSNQLRPYRDLLQIASRYYGWFDPFLMFKNTLFTRNDQASGWNVAKNANQLRLNFEKEMQSLNNISKISNKNESFNIRSFLDFIENEVS